MLKNIEITFSPINRVGKRPRRLLLALLPLAVFCGPAQAQQADFLRQVWVYNGAQREATGNQLAVFNTPCFDYLRVFFAGSNGTCSAVFKRTGELSWCFYTGEPLTNGLHLSEGGPLIVAGAACVYALNPENGLLLWKRSFDDPLSTNITKADRSIIAADSQGNLLCLAAEDGSFRWQTTLPAPIRSTPLFMDGRLYVGADDGKVICYDAADGKRIWEISLDMPVRSGFAVADGRLYFGGDDDYVYCVDADSGSLRWRSRATGNITGLPVCNEGTLFIAPGDRTLRAYNNGNGHYRNGSPIRLTGSLRVAPVVENEMLIYPMGRELIAISPKSFAKLGGFTYAEEITTAVAFDSEENAFYFGSQNGCLVAVGTAAAPQPVDRLPQTEPSRTVTTIPAGGERETPEPETLETTEGLEPGGKEKTGEDKEDKPQQTAEEPSVVVTEQKEELRSEEAKAEKPAEQPESEDEKEDRPAETQPLEDDTVRTEETADETVALEERPAELSAEEALPKAREATAAGNLEEASRLWKLALAGDNTLKYTVTIGLFCRREAALSLIRNLKDGDVMVFERRLGESVCFFVCLGLYDDREAALQALAALDLEKLQAQPSVYRMDSFVP
jgi:outer membrane protein assembly factor BamB